MYQISDEELFGMIPRRGQPHLVGNATEERLSFLDAYEIGLKMGGIFPQNIVTSIRYAPGWDEWEKVDKKREHALSLELKGEYRLAFPKVEQLIEEHLEKTNGYIGAFPPTRIALFSDYESCKFDYFYSAPKDYRPPMEKSLNQAYQNAYQNLEERLPKALCNAVLAILAFVLVLIGGGIFTMFPALGDWVAAGGLNFNICCIVIVAFLEIAGWITFFPQFADEDKDHSLTYIVMMILIGFLSCGHFALTVSPSSESWIEGLFVGMFSWPVRIYFGAVCFIQVGFAISGVHSLRHYRKNLSRYQDAFIQVFEADYNKLYRYLRLRQLWCANESQSTPRWLNELGRRLYDYREEYDVCKRSRR